MLGINIIQHYFGNWKLSIIGCKRKRTLQNTTFFFPSSLKDLAPPMMETHKDGLLSVSFQYSCKSRMTFFISSVSAKRTYWTVELTSKM